MRVYTSAAAEAREAAEDVAFEVEVTTLADGARDLRFRKGWGVSAHLNLPSLAVYVCAHPNTCTARGRISLAVDERASGKVSCMTSLQRVQWGKRQQKQVGSDMRETYSSEEESDTAAMMAGAGFWRPPPPPSELLRVIFVFLASESALEGPGRDCRGCCARNVEGTAMLDGRHRVLSMTTSTCKPRLGADTTAEARRDGRGGGGGGGAARLADTSAPLDSLSFSSSSSLLLLLL